MDVSFNRTFRTIYIEFIEDTLTTFPEYKSVVECDTNIIYPFLNNHDTAEDCSMIIEHCKTHFLPHFFHIMYQDKEMFNSEEPLEFIPNIDFRILWNDTQLTEKTRNVIWKYLQLILFELVHYTRDTSSFGSAEDLFKAIDDKQLKEKMSEVIENMKTMFNDTEDTTISSEDISQNINVDDIHSHIQSLMGGTLGSLAKEIAEETAKDMNLDDENNNEKSFEQIMKQLFQNPTKLMSLIKKIGSKIDTKIKSGDVDEQQMMNEAQDILKKMKHLGHRVPHMRQLKRMMGQMSSMDGVFKPGRDDAQRERMRKKLQNRNKQSVYSVGEKPEQSMLNEDNSKTNKKKKRRRGGKRHRRK